MRKLEKYPVFNLKTLKDIIDKDSGYSKLVIYRLKKDKLIFEIEKNKYTTKKDVILISSNILWPSYISGWSALRYYNLTEQLPQIILIITTRKRKKKEIKFNNTKIIFTNVKPKYFFGYKKERYGDFDIFIAEKEKALIDSALLKKVSFSEIFEIVRNNIKDINVDLLISYLIKIKNKTLIKRFGFLLDKLGIDKYNELNKFINSKYIILDYALAEKGKKNRKWKVIENVKL
jgi:predicted transcriptional regulator of viral defense system